MTRERTKFTTREVITDGCQRMGPRPLGLQWEWNWRWIFALRGVTIRDGLLRGVDMVSIPHTTALEVPCCLSLHGYGTIYGRSALLATLLEERLFVWQRILLMNNNDYLLDISALLPSPLRNVPSGKNIMLQCGSHQTIEIT
jgi:hypothetical protein